MRKLKLIFACILSFAMVLTMGLAGCKPAAVEEAEEVVEEAVEEVEEAVEEAVEEVEEAVEPQKIAFFVSELTITFLAGQFASAKEYAAEKYGAEVTVFDGKSDSNLMTQLIDQVLAQGMDMATLQVWDQGAAVPGILNGIENGIIFNTFYSPVADSGIPVVRNTEAEITYEMGVEMATQWKEAHPDKPIVFMMIGWPDYPEVSTGRTEPFTEGVMSVDPTATSLGCLDGTQGQDQAKQVMIDTVTQHPEVNIIYGEASHITVGIMAGLQQMGRGKMDDGVPLTEIVCSTDFDQVEFKQVYDPDSSLKLSMALPTIETSYARIDSLFGILNGEIPQTSQPPEITWADCDIMSYWTVPREDSAAWLLEQFDVVVE